MIASLLIAGAVAAEGVIPLDDAEAAPPGWVEVQVRTNRDSLRVHVTRTRGPLAKEPFACTAPCAFALRSRSHEIWISGGGRTPGVTVLRPVVGGRYVVSGRMRSKAVNWTGRSFAAAGLGLVTAGVLVGLRADRPTFWDGGEAGRALLVSGAASVVVGIPLMVGSRSRLTVERR